MLSRLSRPIHLFLCDSTVFNLVPSAVSLAWETALGTRLDCLQSGHLIQVDSYTHSRVSVLERDKIWILQEKWSVVERNGNGLPKGKYYFLSLSSVFLKAVSGLKQCDHFLGHV